MKKPIVVIVSILFLAPLVVNAQQDVEIRFVSGFGIKIEVYNQNDYPIYNLTLRNIEISGIIVFGVSPGVLSVGEVPPDSAACLSFLVFGIGVAYVNAYVYYEANGKIIGKDIHCEAEVIGPIVLILDQW